jgi:hypothetical protein
VQGERTLCVLTKLDKLRAGEEAGRALTYLTNQKKPLRLGYHGLVNTVPAEEERVRRDPTFERVRHRIGIRPLRQHLIRILADRILRALPGLRRSCDARQTAISSELRSLGALDEDAEEATATSRVFRLAVPLVKGTEA